MVDLFQSGVYLIDGEKIITDDQNTVSALLQVGKSVTKDEARKGTISYQILAMHDSSDDPDTLCLKYDSLTSHDITYVGILQTARASGMKEIPLPYVLTNCHNSLCAVGGTINEDDHVFALSAAKKYGGIFVPANLGVIHSYNREVMAGCGRMILGSDSHTRYGALGTMAVGEGGGELVKQLVGRTCDLPRPEVIAVYLEGRLQAGVGPQDVALAIIGKVYHNGYVKNKVMEFVGPGIAGLSVELRNGIDVMTTETACWSSIWETDEKVREYYRIHGREQDYQALAPSDVAYYDGLIYVDLSQIKPMIAMPFHPSNIYTIAELKENLSDILDIVEKKCLSQLGVSNLHMNLQSKIHQGEF